MTGGLDDLAALYWADATEATNLFGAGALIVNKV
jgi:hypothetical protein